MEERQPEKCWVLEGGSGHHMQGSPEGRPSQGVGRACFCVKFGYALKKCVILHPVAMDATPANSRHASAIFHVVNTTVTASIFFACL